MTRRIRVIGIGAGNPEHLTVEAIGALNSCDVLFLPDKGAEKGFLAALRHGICDRYITGTPPRRVGYAVPRRREGGDYALAVQDWHAELAAIFGRLLIDETGENEVAGLLVWGDPMLYDSTLRILDTLRAGGGVAFEHDVIPGISSLQALCARLRIPLNRIGAPVEITTGRRLAAGWPGDVADVAVMLDGARAYETVNDPEAEIHWGAYLGTPMEITLSGRLAETGPEITRLRAAARAEHGWIMDCYIIRRPLAEGGAEGGAA